MIKTNRLELKKEELYAKLVYFTDSELVFAGLLDESVDAVHKTGFCHLSKLFVHLSIYSICVG